MNLFNSLFGFLGASSYVDPGSYSQQAQAKARAEERAAKPTEYEDGFIVDGEYEVVKELKQLEQK